MRDPRDIIKRPVITERSMEMMAEKKYTFDTENSFKSIFNFCFIRFN
ncbi:hypothetical protein ACT4UM_13080, partial [Bacillus sp. SS-TM]